MAIKEIIKTQKSNTEIPKILNTKCKNVNGIDTEIEQLIQDLKDSAAAAVNPQAAGLSAPQIGIDKRVCLVKKFRKNSEDPEEEIAEDIILINPEITSISPASDVRFEGCLSIPDLYGRVQRAKRIKVTALDEKGEEIKIKAEGFFARIIQHEIDHLNGILFTEKVVGELLTEEELDRLYETKL